MIRSFQKTSVHNLLSSNLSVLGRPAKAETVSSTSAVQRSVEAGGFPVQQMSRRLTSLDSLSMTVAGSFIQEYPRPIMTDFKFEQTQCVFVKKNIGR